MLQAGDVLLDSTITQTAWGETLTEQEVRGECSMAPTHNTLSNPVNAWMSTLLQGLWWEYYDVVVTPLAE